jgi:hypothetical protein
MEPEPVPTVPTVVVTGGSDFTDDWAGSEG